VNGVIQPVLHVHLRSYRFRWLNSDPSRFYKIYITYLNNLSATISSGRRSPYGAKEMPFALMVPIATVQ